MLDPSAVASWTEGGVGGAVLVCVAGTLRLSMIVPNLATEEVLELRPDDTLELNGLIAAAADVNIGSSNIHN